MLFLFRRLNQSVKDLTENSRNWENQLSALSLPTMLEKRGPRFIYLKESKVLIFATQCVVVCFLYCGLKCLTQDLDDTWVNLQCISTAFGKQLARTVLWSISTHVGGDFRWFLAIQIQLSTLGIMNAPITVDTEHGMQIFFVNMAFFLFAWQTPSGFL